MVRNLNMNTSHDVSKAHLEAPISGPNGSARMLVDGHEVGDQWVLDEVVIRFSDGVEINLLDESE
jgi:hypothetical protein